MKNFKSALLVVAAASLLTACGNGDSTSSSEGKLEPGASVMGGVVIDYTSDANLMSASVFGDFSGGFIYTPLANTEIQIVPTFAGKNTLSHAEINGKRYEPVVSEDFKVTTYMGELDLSGVPYIKYTMTTEVPTVKLFSKATEGTTHKVTLNIEDKTSTVQQYDTIESAWSKITGSKIDSYFGKAGTHTVEVLEGAAAGFLIQGADLENYHKGYFGYGIQAEGTTIAWNTLEASIDNTMKTASIWKMPKNDITVNIAMSDALIKGESNALVHGAGYVGKATAGLTKDYKGNVKLASLTLNEYCLPSYITIADEDKASFDAGDYVTGQVLSHGSAVTQNWYKTVKFGDITLTATLGALSGQEGENWLSYVDAEGNNPFATEEGCKAWADAVIADAVTIELKAGNKTVGNKEFNKDVNGYGGSKFDWKMNRDATIAMVMDYGVEAALAAKKGEDGKHWVITDENGDEIETGATWTDLNTVKEGSTSYAQLLKNALDKANEAAK